MIITECLGEICIKFSTLFFMNIPTIIEAMNILGLVLEDLHTRAVEVSRQQAHRQQDLFIGKFKEIIGFW